MSAWPRTEMLRRCKTAREPDGASPRTLPPAIRAPAAILAARADRGRSSWPRLVCRNGCGGRALGPDHPTTLVSAVALTLALVYAPPKEWLESPSPYMTTIHPRNVRL